MENHILSIAYSSLLLLVFIFSSVNLVITSQFSFDSSKQVHNSANVSCIESERQALLQFRHGLTDESNRLSSWIEGLDCCSWEGVRCHETTGTVLKLDLCNTVPFYSEDNIFLCKNCLGGQLSPSLVNLTYLRYLDLSGNNFSGIQVPTFLGSLRNLRYLNLSGAVFAGEIPHHLGNLSHLRYLDLGRTTFSPRNWLTAKDLHWVARLSSLESLDLSYMDLSAAQDGLQTINMLPSLATLGLSKCKLFINPHLSPHNFTSLSSFDLSSNNFSNYMIPSWLHNLTALQNLDLSYNSLTNPNIQGLFQQMASLVYLDLSFNRFGANLILKSLCNLSSLTHLDLYSNKLQGSIPSEIGQLPKLTTLILRYNNLNGTLPINLWHLPKLQELDIAGNSLTGVLSEHHFAQLRELKSLSLFGNLIALNVSSSWVPPFHQIEEILMSSIKVGPRFPAWLRTLKRLRSLDMQNASISDAIPSWFRGLCQDVGYLDLSNNQLTGNPLPYSRDGGGDRVVMLNSAKLNGSLKSFPSDILFLYIQGNFLTGHIPVPEFGGQTVASTIILRLNDNRFTGSIPKELCKLKKLQYLDLSNNLLSGEVPLCLGNMLNLLSLNLANNSLCGRIPSSLGNLWHLLDLHLNENKFVGELPSLMQHMRSLQVLDLGDNGLNDTIPAWIGERLSNLMFLRFQCNNFQGGISDKLCLLSSLQVLNLADNNLTGVIPHCFNNFSMTVSTKPATELSYPSLLLNYKGGKELEYTSNLQSVKSISLSTNNLVGEVPDSLMDLVGLQVLNLSKNHLSGRIPGKIGILKNLETLDLSRNDLCDAIPPSLSGLNSLSSLNLSYNNLSGQIPSGNQLQTLLDPSIYEGNSGLCGKPLPKECHELEHKLPAENGPTDDDEREFDWPWFYAGLGPGFSVGLLAVLGILVFKKSWRYAYFRFIENTCDRVWEMTALKTTRLQRTGLH